MTDTNTRLAPPPRQETSHTTAQPRRRFDLRQGGEVFALVLLVVVFTLINPDSFLTVVNVQTMLDQASTPLIIGVGATLVILLGCIDLSVEGLMSACGLAFVLLSANSRDTADLGAWAILIGVLLGAALGLANGLVHTVLKIPSFIVTLGMGFVGFGIATLLFGDSQLPFLKSNGLKDWPTDKLLGLTHSFWLAALVVAVGLVVTRFTKLGRYTYAIGNSEPIARDNGVAVARYKVAVFTIAGACSGLAGVLTTMQLGSAPARIGIGMLFLTIAAVVIGGTSLGGGKGGIFRTTIGVLMLTVINNGLIQSDVSPNVQTAVSGGVLVLAIVAASWPHRSRLRIMK
ncbi:ABC transporter permease [Nocardioides marmoribigeumensis]|uniref:Ribose transport system permease protein n=1 Tax=Nocardioides marmoribigeumensis TaxID=433649 RepID=A0ABU2BT34_9ACTN|nr:ABC transporter permease [Nocardioides marmoribigeumensis]MDR7361793.1 ribose transport system permease protein [Nocardioides marmoribigeumensis]